MCAAHIDSKPPRLGLHGFAAHLHGCTSPIMVSFLGLGWSIPSPTAGFVTITLRDMGPKVLKAPHGNKGQSMQDWEVPKGYFSYSQRPLTAGFVTTTLRSIGPKGLSRRTSSSSDSSSTPPTNSVNCTSTPQHSTGKSQHITSPIILVDAGSEAASGSSTPPTNSINCSTPQHSTAQRSTCLLYTSRRG